MSEQEGFPPDGERPASQNEQAPAQSAARQPLPDDHPLSAKSMLRDAAKDSGEIAVGIAVDLFYRGAMLVGLLLAFFIPIAAIAVGGLLTWRAFNTGSSKVGPIFTLVLAVVVWVSTGSPLGGLRHAFG